MKLGVILAVTLSFVFMGCSEGKNSGEVSTATLDLKFETGFDLMNLGEQFLMYGNYRMAVLYYRHASRHEDSACASLQRIDEICRVARLYGTYPPCGLTSSERKYLEECGYIQSLSRGHFGMARDLSKRGEHLGSKYTLLAATMADPNWGPPYCMLAVKIENHEEDDDPSVLETCKACLKLASGEQTNWCWRTLEMYSGSGKEILDRCEVLLAGEKYTDALRCFRIATYYDDTVGIAHKRMGDIYSSEPNLDLHHAHVQYYLAFKSLTDRGQKQLAEEVSRKLSKIYEAREKDTAPLNCQLHCDDTKSSYGPPHCILGVHLSLNDSKRRKKTIEVCRCCVKYASGEITKPCKEILKMYWWGMQETENE